MPVLHCYFVMIGATVLGCLIFGVSSLALTQERDRRGARTLLIVALVALGVELALTVVGWVLTRQL